MAYNGLVYVGSLLEVNVAVRDVVPMTRGLQCLRERDYVCAEFMLTRQLETSPGDRRAIGALAIAQQRQSKYADAIVTADTRKNGNCCAAHRRRPNLTVTDAFDTSAAVTASPWRWLIDLRAHLAPAKLMACIIILSVKQNLSPCVSAVRFWNPLTSMAIIMVRRAIGSSKR